MTQRWLSRVCTSQLLLNSKIDSEKSMLQLKLCNEPFIKFFLDDSVVTQHISALKLTRRINSWTLILQCFHILCTTIEICWINREIFLSGKIGEMETIYVLQKWKIQISKEIFQSGKIGEMETDLCSMKEENIKTPSLEPLQL